MSSILATMSPAKNEKQDIQLSMWCIEVDISERNNFHIGHFCIIVTVQNSASCLLVDAIGTYNVTSILSTYIESCLIYILSDPILRCFRAILLNT